MITELSHYKESLLTNPSSIQSPLIGDEMGGVISPAAFSVSCQLPSLQRDESVPRFTALEEYRSKDVGTAEAGSKFHNVNLHIKFHFF